MAKSKNDYLIKKWSFLLEGLKDGKRDRYKFSKLYENSSLMNSFEDFKLVASILYKTFKNIENIYLSNSKKNKYEISRIEESSLFDYNKILIDFFENFTNKTSEDIIDKVNEGEIEKIHHLRVDHDHGQIVVSIVY